MLYDRVKQSEANEQYAVEQLQCVNGRKLDVREIKDQSYAKFIKICM